MKQAQHTLDCVQLAAAFARARSAPAQHQSPIITKAKNFSQRSARRRGGSGTVFPPVAQGRHGGRGGGPTRAAGAADYQSKIRMPRSARDEGGSKLHAVQGVRRLDDALDGYELCNDAYCAAMRVVCSGAYCAATRIVQRRVLCSGA